jgi:hypothetical protein
MTTSAHGSLASERLCCPSRRRYYDPIRQSRQLPPTSQGHWLYGRSVPDDLVWAASETFPALGQRSFLACHRPYAERRNGETPAPPRSQGFPQQNSASAPLSHPTPASVGDLLTTLQRSRDGTARKVAGPPGLVRPGVSSGRRGRIHPSLPEAGRPHPESGMTTPPFWGRTMTGLTPAGALPLQAARCVANLHLRPCAV